MKPIARRLRGAKPYVFQTLAEMRRDAVRRGVDVIDLGVGNPDSRPHDSIVAELHHALDDRGHANHRYPPFDGTPEFREAIATWYERRFGVSVSPDGEVLPVVGTKEGLGHLLLALLDPGDTMLVPSPAYPAYRGAATIAEARVVEMPLREENGFRIDPAAVPAAEADRAKLLIVNHPGNPTGACADRGHYRDLLAFAERYDLVVVSDIAYADLTLEPGAPAPSFLELEGAKERTLEFYSFSKTYHMAGWRVGFAAGSRELVSALLRVKTNLDFGVFGAIQQAAARILLGPRERVEETCTLYRARRDALVPGLRELGWPVTSPEASMYLWTRIPDGFPDSFGFVRELFDKTGILVSPGSAFGEAGEGYVRISLVAGEARTREALERIRESGVLV